MLDSTGKIIKVGSIMGSSKFPGNKDNPLYCIKIKSGRVHLNSMIRSDIDIVLDQNKLNNSVWIIIGFTTFKENKE